MGEVEFKEVPDEDPITKQKKGDAIVVIRDGHQVAVLPEADRLRRALNLSVDEINDTLSNFSSIMGREPTSDEREFWKAVLDYKSGDKSR
jgi:hypothetical protein